VALDLVVFMGRLGYFFTTQLLRLVRLGSGTTSPPAAGWGSLCCTSQPGAALRHRCGQHDAVATRAPAQSEFTLSATGAATGHRHEWEDGARQELRRRIVISQSAATKSLSAGRAHAVTVPVGGTATREPREAERAALRGVVGDAQPIGEGRVVEAAVVGGGRARR
jgi:hypothetical protein